MLLKHFRALYKATKYKAAVTNQCGKIHCVRIFIPAKYLFSCKKDALPLYHWRRVFGSLNTRNLFHVLLNFLFAIISKLSEESDNKSGMVFFVSLNLYLNLLYIMRFNCFKCNV